MLTQVVHSVYAIEQHKHHCGEILFIPCSFIPTSKIFITKYELSLKLPSQPCTQVDLKSVYFCQKSPTMGLFATHWDGILLLVVRQSNETMVV